MVEYEKTVVKQQMAPHKSFSDSGTLFCPKSPLFDTERKQDLNYHLHKHHAPQVKKICTVCTLCLNEFPTFYSLQQHKRRKHGTWIKTGIKSCKRLKEVLELENLDKNDERLQQELSACQHFCNKFEIKNGRYRVFNFKLLKLDPSKNNEQL